MKKYIILIPLCILCYASVTHAGDLNVNSVITDWFDKIVSMIPSSPSAISGIALVLELLLRFVPTAQPLSVISYISEFCKHLGTLLAAVADFLDKVIGNRISSVRMYPAKPAPYYNPPKVELK